MKRQTRSTSKGRAVLYKARYRSRLEERIADQLDEAGISFQYENRKVKYTVPARHATYTPDFDLGPYLIEAKGYFRSAADRQKLVLVKRDNPDVQIRLVFQKANNPIYKGSPTTYAKWAEDHGFQWADGGVIPDEWLKEITNDTKRNASASPSAQEDD